MNAEKFWYGWLKVAAALCSFLGILMALFNQTPFFNHFNEHIEKMLYSHPQLGINVSEFRELLVSVSGTIIAAWGIAMLFLIIYPLQRKELWSWRALTISLLVWFSLDTYVSTYYGITINALVNVVFGLQFFAPLLFLRKTMQPRLKESV